MNKFFRGIKPTPSKKKEGSNFSNHGAMNQVLLKVASLRTFIFHLRSASHNSDADFNEAARIFLVSQEIHEWGDASDMN